MRTDLIRLTFLGALVGVAAGAVVLAFRWLIEAGQMRFLPDGSLGNYEALPHWAILALPAGGGLVLGLIFDRLPQHLRAVGIVHIIQQLRHTGRPDLPLANAVVQFLAGSFAIVCGHSVDREGPGVHLGAAAGTQVGRKSEDAETFTLTASGAAAAIAAAFNTPLAGVVFVIEVLGVRYRVDRFIPIITASVTGALVSRAAYGATPSFSIGSELNMGSLYELGLLALLGFVIGLMAVAFTTLTERASSFTCEWRPSIAFTTAGLLTGLIGLAYPQILGISYDTLDGILNAHLTGGVLIGLALGKLIATAVSIGLRVPGGLIGPSLVIGGAMGGLLGSNIQYLALNTGSESFYATIGMIAMMSAVLRAPLAAMLGLLELTAEPNIIFPGMTAVVCADLVARQMLGKESVFEHLRRLTNPND
ncbi:MAG: chloride channel protein [Chromatiaceae bacterium]|jgi:CIC family chloride channel protein|nr:chloride channel protein [Chromatiaceae bacterium]